MTYGRFNSEFTNHKKGQTWKPKQFYATTTKIIIVTEK